MSYNLATLKGITQHENVFLSLERVVLYNFKETKERPLFHSFYRGSDLPFLGESLEGSGVETMYLLKKYQICKKKCEYSFICKHNEAKNVKKLRYMINIRNWLQIISKLVVWLVKSKIIRNLIGWFWNSPIWCFVRNEMLIPILKKLTKIFNFQAKWEEKFYYNLQTIANFYSAKEKDNTVKISVIV